MPMVFTFSTKVTILFSWWSTSTVVSYVISLFFLILLALFNRFLGILKLQLDRTPTHSHYKPSDVPKLSLPPSRWTQNQSSKDRGSPLPPQLEVNHDTDGHAAFPSTPSLGPTPHLYSDQREQESHGVDSHPRFDHSLRPHRKWNWSQDIIGSMLEGVRALTGYALCVYGSLNNNLHARMMIQDACCDDIQRRHSLCCYYGHRHWRSVPRPLFNPDSIFSVAG